MAAKRTTGTAAHQCGLLRDNLANCLYASPTRDPKTKVASTPPQYPKLAYISPGILNPMVVRESNCNPVNRANSMREAPSGLSGKRTLGNRVNIRASLIVAPSAYGALRGTTFMIREMIHP